MEVKEHGCRKMAPLCTQQIKQFEVALFLELVAPSIIGSTALEFDLLMIRTEQLLTAVFWVVTCVVLPLVTNASEEHITPIFMTLTIKQTKKKNIKSSVKPPLKASAWL